MSETSKTEALDMVLVAISQFVKADKWSGTDGARLYKSVGLSGLGGDSMLEYAGTTAIESKLDGADEFAAALMTAVGVPNGVDTLLEALAGYAWANVKDAADILVDVGETAKNVLKLAKDGTDAVKEDPTPYLIAGGVALVLGAVVLIKVG